MLSHLPDPTSPVPGHGDGSTPPRAASSRKFRYGLAGRLVIAIVTMLGVGAVVHRGVERMVEENAWVAHTHSVLEYLANILSLIKDAETATRGYVISGNESFLEPYHQSRAHIFESVDAMQTLVSDNPRQQARISDLRKDLTAKLEHVTETIELRRHKGSLPAQQRIASGIGTEIMGRIRAQIRAMEDEERGLLAQRDRLAAAAAARVRWLVSGAITLNLIALMFAFYLVMRETKRRALVEASLHDSNVNLEQSVNDLGVLHRELTLTSQMGELLLSCRTLEEAYAVFRRVLPPLFPGVAGALGSINASQNLVDIVVEWGNNSENRALFPPDDCWALRRGRPRDGLQ